MLFLKDFVQIVDKHAEVYASIENELRKKKAQIQLLIWRVIWHFTTLLNIWA